MSENSSIVELTTSSNSGAIDTPTIAELPLSNANPPTPKKSTVVNDEGKIFFRFPSYKFILIYYLNR